MRALGLMTLLALAQVAVAAPPPGTAEVREARGRVRVGGSAGYLVADKTGVPDALRGSAMVGVTMVSVGKFGLIAEGVFTLGYAENDDFHLRGGLNLEGELMFLPQKVSVYLSTGGFWFHSKAEEVRSGPQWRIALGLRANVGPRAYVGFEPFGLESFPKGEGAQTPLRSKWGWDLTFVTVGVRL